MSDSAKLAVFAGSASPKLTAAICHHLGIAPGRCESATFSEGNTFVRILDNVRGRDVFFVQTVSRPANDRFMELLFWVDAARRASAGSITAVIPFFSYGKGDKKDEPRVSIRARVCADCLEAVGVDRVVTMDLHAPQIQGFFGVPVDHLYGLPLIVEHFRDMVRPPDWVVVAPDVGFGKMASHYARAFGVETAIAEKARDGHDESARSVRIIGSVAGKSALVVDDFMTSGGTLVATAENLVASGAIAVHAAVTHGLLTPPAIRRIAASPLRELVLTDTVEHAGMELDAKFHVVSAARLFAAAIDSIHRRTSVSELFKY